MVAMDAVKNGGTNVRYSLKMLLMALREEREEVRTRDNSQIVV